MSLPEAIQPDGATHVRYRGRRLIYFGGCDYYRLAHHPKLLKAHAQAAARDVALQEIQKTLELQGKKNSDFAGLPDPEQFDREAWLNLGSYC